MIDPTAKPPCMLPERRRRMVMACDRPRWAERDGAGRISPLPPGSVEIAGELGAIRLLPHQSPNGCRGLRSAEPASGKAGRRGVGAPNGGQSMPREQQWIGIDVAKAWLD